jgi:hypothetical protein
MTPHEIAMHLTKALLEARTQVKEGGALANTLPGESEAVAKAYQTIYEGVLAALRSK